MDKITLITEQIQKIAPLKGMNQDKDGAWTIQHEETTTKEQREALEAYAKEISDVQDRHKEKLAMFTAKLDAKYKALATWELPVEEVVVKEPLVKESVILDAEITT